MQVAAAIAVTVAVSDQDASLPAGIVVGSSAASAGVVTLRARGNSDSAASASGQAVTTGPSTGDSVGAAVGLSLAFATTKAGLGAGSQLFAGSLTVEAGTNVRDADGNPATAADDAHVFGAEATSGAGGGKNSVAGSLAFNLVLISATATVGDNSLLSLSGGTGDVAITAGSKSVSTVKALPGTETGASGEAFGLGLSIALSIVIDKTEASVPDGAAIFGARNLSITAHGGHALTTEAENGAAATEGTAVTPVIAISFAEVTSRARLGTLSGTTVLTGGLTIEAEQGTSVSTTAKGDASADGTAVGVSIALTISLHTVAALLDRSVTATGAITIQALGSSGAVADAKASAGGGADEDDASRTNPDGSQRTVDEDVADQRGLAANQSNSLGAGTDTRVNEAPATPSAQSSDADSDGENEKLAVAAAVGVTISVSRQAARVADGLTVTSSGGAFTVKSTGNTDATAKGDGTTADTATDTETSVGAGVAVNLAFVTNEAIVGSGATIQGTSITVEATATAVGTDTTQVFGAEAISGAGDGKNSVAGSIAVNVVLSRTEARLASGVSSTVVAGGTGDVRVVAAATGTSTTKALSAAGATAEEFGLGLSIAVAVVIEHTLALIDDGATITGAAHDLTISATGGHLVVTEARNGAAATNGTAITPVVAVDYAALTTRARLGTLASGPTTQITGAMDVTAQQLAGATTNSIGNTSSASTAIGISIAVTIAVNTVDALVERSLIADGSVSVQALGSSANKADAKASVSGAPNTEDDDSGEDVNDKTDNQLGLLDDVSTENTGQSTGQTESPKATTSDSEDSDDSVAVAGALSLNIVLTKSRALLAHGINIQAGGALTIRSSANSDAEGTADGTTVEATSTGVGVGIVLNYVEITNVASTGNTTLSVNGLTVESVMTNVAGDTTHTIKAIAKSGAGSDKTGIAGALGLNIVNGNHTEATVSGGATVNAGTGNITLRATNTESDTATGTATAEAGETGVGVSIALNILLASVTRAEIEDGAVLSGGNTLSIIAEGTRTIETTVTGGAKGGDTAVTPAVALVVVKGDTVTARLGTTTSPATLTLLGSATIRATHTVDVSKTEAKADAEGKTAVGASVSINVVLEWTTLAELARSTSATSVSVTAESTVNSGTKADASASGASDTDSEADSKANSQVSDNPNTSSLGVGTLPSADESVSEGNSQSSSESGTSSGGVGVAASISVNWVVTTNTARIMGGTSVTGRAGAVVVSASNQTDATARATGVAINADSLTSEEASNQIGAAVGLNVAQVTNTATIGAGAVINASGSITVEAITPAGQRNDMIVWGLAAAGGKSDVSVAGSIAIQVINYDTTASVGKGARLTSGDAVTVKATAPFGLQSLAISGALSLDGNAIGASVVVNILDDINTQAFIDSDATDVTRVDAVNAIAVTATSSLTSLVPDPVITKITLPSVTSVTVAGGVGSGDAAVGGSFIIDVFFITTKAFVGDNAQVNQITTASGAGQSLSLIASDSTEVTNIAGALGATTGSAGVGVSVIVEVITKDVDAHIGKNATVRAGGDVVISAASSEDFFDLAVAGGASTSAGVAGSILVVLLNAFDEHGTTAYIDDNATVRAGGKVDVLASDAANKLELSSGNIAIGSEAGVGVSSVILVRNGTVDAAVHQGAQVSANGGTGLSVVATQSEDMLLIAVGGAGGGTAGVGGSVVVDLLTNRTKAHIDNAVIVGGTATPSAAVHVAASDTTTILSLAGALAIGGTAGVGAGVDVEVIDKQTEAWIAPAARVTTTGDVTVDATSNERMTSLAVGGGFGGTASVNVNVGVSVINVTTRAFIEGAASFAGAAHVNAGGSVRVAADEKFKIDIVGGNISGGGSAAVGAAAAVPIVTKETHAWIGDNATVNAAGGSAVDVKTGNFTVTPIDTRFDPRLTGTYNAGTDTIDLGYAHGLKAGQAVLYDNGGGATLPGLTDGTPYYVILAGGNSVKLADSYCHAVGYVGDHNCTFNPTPETIPGDPTSDPDHSDDFTPIVVTPINLQPLVVGALYGESHRLVASDQAGVRKDESPRFNPSREITSGVHAANVTTDTITLPYELDGVVTGDKLVYSSGGGDAIGGLVDGETYYAIRISSTQFKVAATRCDAIGENTDLNDDCPGTDPPTAVNLTSTGSGRSHSLVKGGTLPSGDASAAGPRNVTAGSNSFRGVSVTATNSDEIAAVGVSAGISGTAAVNLSGAVNVVTVHTTAHIGKAAHINCGLTCATNVSGANSDQSVRVVAGNQYYELGIAATLAIGGSVGVGVGVGVHLVNLNTDAYIDDAAHVNAAKDVEVNATGKDTIVSVVAGASGGQVGVAGTFTVTILNTHTHACLGSWTDEQDNRGCNAATVGVTIVAGNNVLIAARDDTRIMQITASVAGGYVGVGVAVGVAQMTKDTQAYVGTGSHIDAKAQNAASGLRGVYNGTFTASSFGTGACGLVSDPDCFHGLAVQAGSSENVFGLSASAGGGFVGVAGGVGVTILKATTKAFIAGDARINQLASTSLNQSVSVSAVDSFTSLTVAGGVAGGFVGVAGGIDIGVANSSVQAYIGIGSIVFAKSNVDVNALSRKKVSTYAASVGGGFVGVAGSVNVWTVGTQPTTAYNDGAAGPPRGEWSSATASAVYDDPSTPETTLVPDTSVRYRKGDVVTFNGKTYAAKIEQPLQDPTHADEWLGETDSLAASEGEEIDPSAPDWVSGTVYSEGDEVVYQGSHYKARRTTAAPTQTPNENLDDWVGLSSGGSAQGSADEVASGNDSSNGAPGFKNVLMGTTAAAAPAWAPSTAYPQGKIVLYNGRHYRAKVAVPDTATATPTSDLATWEDYENAYQRDNMVNSRVSAHTTSSSAAISSKAPSGSVATGALTPATPVPDGTFAAVHGTIVAGDSVRIRANDKLEVLGLAGAVAGGFVGVGVAVLILNVESKTEAKIGGDATITAGSGAGDVILVDADLDETATGISFAGGGGFVGVGAQVVVFNDSGTQRAHIDDNAKLLQAGGGVDVTAGADRTVATYGIGVSTGAFSTGAAIAHTNVTGDTIAEIGDVAVGTGTGSGPVGHLGVHAIDTITAPTLAIAVAAGVGVGVSGAMAFTNLTGVTRATSGAHGSIGSGGVSITSLGTHTLIADTVNVAVGIGATGVTVARANQDRDTEATVGSTGIITTSGAVLVSSASANTTDVSAPGGAGGGVAITALLAFAILSGDTKTTVNGSFTTTTNDLDITIRATGENAAKAESLTVSVSVVGANGGVAVASVTGDIEAHVAAASQLSSQGAVVVDAHTTGTGTTATATVKSAGHGGFASLAIMFADARVEGDVRAQLDGDVLASDALTVTANGLTRAVATAEVLSASLGFAGTAAGTLAEISGDIEALVGGTSSVAAAGGAVAVTAAGDLASTASSQVGSGGGIAVAVTLPTARVSGDVRAQLAGDVVTGASLTVKASGPLVATATSSPTTLGLAVAINGVSSEATVSGAVEALIGARVNVAAGANIPDVNVTGAVKVSASSSMTASAIADGINAAGIVGIGIMLPTATVSGATRAVVRDGVDMTAASLSVEAGIFDNPLTPTDETDAVDYSATATTKVLGVGALAAIAVVNADATVSGVVEAYIGAPLTVAAGGAPATTIAVGATTVRALGTMVTNAKANGTGVGVGLSANEMIPTARTSGTIRAYAGQGADIVGSTLTVTADAPTMTATAETIAISVGLGAGNVVNATAIVQGTVDAHVGAVAGSTPAVNSTVVTLTGDVDVAASSTMTANATANGGAGGAISVAVMLPSATVSGVTRAYVGEGTNLDAGTLDVTAASAMQSNATTKAFGIGLLGSAQGLRSEATVTGTVESFIGAQAANTVGVLTDVDVTGATNVTADGTMKAIAVANGLGASLTAAINIMLPTATDSGRAAAYVRDGVKLAAGSLQVRAGQLGTPVVNLAQATSNSLTGGLLGSGSLVKADAVVSSTVEAYIGAPGSTTGGSTSATIVVDDAIVIGAYSDTQAIAKSDGTGASAGLTIAVMLPTADAAGTTRAFVGQGVDITADSLDIDANGALDAKATSVVISVGGLGAGTGARAKATVSGTVDAHIGSAAGAAPASRVATINVGDIDIDADAVMTATPTLTAASVGGIEVSALFPTAVLKGIVRAYIGEGVDITAASLHIEASAPNLDAISTATATGISALFGLGILDADAINSSQVEAFIGAHRSIAAGGVTDVDVTGAIEILVDTSITANASADSVGFSGGIKLTGLSPTALVDAYAGIYVRDGVDLTASVLTLQAGTPGDRIPFTATATGNAVGIGLLAAGALVQSEAILGGAVEAFIGAPTGFTPNTTGLLDIAGAITVSAASDMDAISTVDSTQVALVAINALIPTAWVTGATRAYAGDGSFVKTTGLTITADSDVRADATTLSFTVGIAAGGNGAGAEAIVVSQTEAYLGKRADTASTSLGTVDVRTPGGARGTIDVNAISRSVAHAQNDGVAASFGLAVSIMVPKAKLAGYTSAYVGPYTSVYAGDTTLTANEPIATAEATTLGVTAGTVAVSELIADSRLSRVTETFVGHHAQLDLLGSTLTATATSPAATATAFAKGGAGGFVTISKFEARASLGNDTVTLPALPADPEDYDAVRPTAGTRAVTRSYIDHSAQVHAHDVDLDADSTTLADADVSFVGISAFFDLSVSTVEANVGHDTETYIGDDAVVDLTGTLWATATTDATSSPQISQMGISGGVSVSALTARGRITSDTRAWVGNGADVDADAVDLDADATHDASVTINSSGFAFLLDIDLLQAVAEDTGTSTVRIGPQTRGAWAEGARYLAGDVVTGSDSNVYTARTNHVATAADNPSLQNTTSQARWSNGGQTGSSGNRTEVTTTTAGGLKVDALLNSTVRAEPRFQSFSLLLAASSAKSIARNDATVSAIVGNWANLSSGPGDLHVQAEMIAKTVANASGIAGAPLGVAVTNADADHDPTVLAVVGSNASLASTGLVKKVEMLARHNYGTTDPIADTGAIRLRLKRRLRPRRRHRLRTSMQLRTPTLRRSFPVPPTSRRTLGKSSLPRTTQTPLWPPSTR